MKEKEKPKSVSSRQRADDSISIILESESGPLYLSNPNRVIKAWHPGEFHDALKAMDAARRSGLILAGYISYEISPLTAIRENFHSNPDEKAPLIPLLWFGCFEKAGEPVLSRDSYSLKREMEPDVWLRLAGNNFRRSLSRIKEHLGAGDVYEVNYTLKEDFRFEGDSLALYDRLRSLQSSNFGAYIRTEDLEILSFSPELFFRTWNDLDGSVRIECSPMKGTVPSFSRGGVSPAKALSSEKNRAENTMIVDLIRNDLGVHAEPGSVKVTSLFEMVQLSTVKQLISRVEARLSPEKKEDLLSRLFTSLFPSGSITGAPKEAACKIIAKLETKPRGVYTGAIGCVLPDGTSSFNVAIRTLEINRKSGRASFGAGCGIVWDSSFREEWAEYSWKSAFLRPALDDFRVIETLYCEDGKFLFLRQHLRRMAASAAAFSVPFSARSALEILKKVENSGNYRIRLLLDRSGRFEAESSVCGRINRTGASSSPFRLELSAHRVDSGDIFRYHKTTERRPYDRSRRVRIGNQNGDVFFLNEQGHVVESSIGNILLYHGKGKWSTPDATSGCLPGVFIGQLLRRFSDRIGSRKIALQDMTLSKRVFVCNSVRGFTRVTGLVTEQDGIGNER